MNERGKGEEGRRSVIGENYSACGKIFSRLMLGQWIEPVSAGNRIAPLSTPQLSQSRNCSLSPLTITDHIPSQSHESAPGADSVHLQTNPPRPGARQSPL